MNQSILYVSYIEDSLKTLSKIYEEIFQYSHLNTFEILQPSHENTKNNETLQRKIMNSTHSIQSWGSALDKRTKVVGSYLGNSHIPAFDYTIEHELWQTHMYVETTTVSFVHLNLNVEFVFYPQYPEQGKYMLLIREKGITFTLVYEETENTVRSIEIVRGIRLIFSDEILNSIKQSDKTRGDIEIFSPTYFGSSTFLRVRLPFHPLKLYLHHIGWIRSVLDDFDAHILQLRLGLFYFLSSQGQNLQAHAGIQSFKPEIPLNAIQPPHHDDQNDEKSLQKITGHFMYMP